MNTYVTFGQIHCHNIDGKILDKDTVAVIPSKSEEQGRQRALELFGTRFFTTYYDDQWNESNLFYYPKGYVVLD